ncbi:MAG: DUF3098 domain-containing protein [Rikenellaceae bacterium]
MNKLTQEQLEKKEALMPLAMKNYKLMLIGFAIIVVGFALMAGGGGTSADFFNEEMFSFRRITLAPIVVLFGFGFEIYAIMKKYK